MCILVDAGRGDVFQASKTQYRWRCRLLARLGNNRLGRRSLTGAYCLSAPWIEQLDRQPCKVFLYCALRVPGHALALWQHAGCRWRAGASCIANQPAQAISDVHRQYASGEEKRHVRFEPNWQHLASLRVRRTRYPSANLARGQLHSGKACWVGVW